MRTVKTKIIMLVLSGIIISSLFIGGASIINSGKVVNADSVQIMNLLCKNRGNEINTLFIKIEQSVETLTVYATRQIDNMELFKTDSNYVDSYADNLIEVATNAAQNTEGAVAVYIRFNPEFTDSKSGFFYTKNSENNDFVETEPTDLGLYEASNTEYVGWYYNAIEAGEGTWVEPYYNRNINVEMISYVIPFYIDNELVGVVGMDIDFNFLINVVANTSIYKSGYAFLVDDQANIIYHSDLEMGIDLIDYNNNETVGLTHAIINNVNTDKKLIQYTYNGKSKKSAYTELVNGMRLVLTAPTSEIDEQQDGLLLQIGSSIIIVTIAMAFATIIFARRLVRPLSELTSVAKKVADGDLSVSIEHHSKDEIGILAESFRQTVAHLKKSFADINRLAYLDSLTGIKNKTAYFDLVAQLDQRIGTEELQYGVIVFDINGLKLVNDTYGHDNGDQLIIDACQVICKVFKQSPVFRIGGDEFVVILENEDYKNRKNLLKRFDEEAKNYDPNLNNKAKISVAWGIALYVRDIDACYNDVFKKADSAMYEHKVNMKKIIK